MLRTFDKYSTAEDVLDGVDLKGKVALITGANQGIGLESARALVKAGCTVFLACRDKTRAEEARQDILKSTMAADDKVGVITLDLNSFDAVKAGAAEWNAKKLPLNILINNAGIMAVPPATTIDGFETHYAVNHLGHFLFTSLIFDSLKKGQPSRVVNVSSGAHNMSPVVFEGLGTTKIYEGSWYSTSLVNNSRAYAQSKTANILFAVELNRRSKAAGLKITANALHPGGVHTNLFKPIGGSIAQFFISILFSLVGKTPQQGAATQVWVATAKELDGVGGKYFEDSAEAIPSRLKPYAVSEENAKRLWDVSVQQSKATWDLI